MSYDTKMKRLNFNGSIQLDTPVYRIFSYRRLLELLETKKLTLVKPACWDDPFENFFLQCTVNNGDGTFSGMNPLRESWFGSCWTLTPESDALWRIYSHNKDGVRLKTTAGKLMQAVWNEKDDFRKQKYFIGAVDYTSREKIENFLRQTTFHAMVVGGQNDGLAETLLYKRNEFAHEKEVRVLVHAQGASDSRKITLLDGTDIYQVDIEPDNFIDELTFDPRLKTDKYVVDKSRIFGLGFKGTVSRSTLYGFTPVSIRII